MDRVDAAPCIHDIVKLPVERPDGDVPQVATRGIPGGPAVAGDGDGRGDLAGVLGQVLPDPVGAA